MSDDTDKMHSIIKIVTWNVNDIADRILGDKSSQSDFLSTINSSTIFCLQETKKETNVPNYVCYNDNRDYSRSGGVCIGVHRSLEKHTKELKTGDPDIIAVKVSGSPVSLERDLIIINVYDSPENSSYKKKRIQEGVHVPTLENLLEFVNSTQNCEIFLTGDFNARTGSLNFIPESNDWEDIKNLPACENQRSSKDQTTDSRGRSFLDFISSCNLSVLNGCTLGDIFGEFTCMKYNGNSVVDYMLTSSTLRGKVQCLRVGEITKSLSDHRPVTCTLNLQSVLADTQGLLAMYEDAPKRIKWSPTTSPNLFQEELENNSDITENIKDVNSLKCESRDDVIALNGKIVEIYNKIGHCIGSPQNNRGTGSTSTNNKNTPDFSRRMRPKNKWFDVECIKQKRNLNAAEKKYVKTPSDEYIRCNYYNLRKEYRKLIKMKKNQFFKDLSQEILKNNNLSWDCVKKLKSAYSPSKSTLDIFDMKRFYTFFKNLYQEKHLTKAQYKEKSHKKAEITHMLDKPITLSELSANVQNLKNGKAGGLDRISNEFLKASSGGILELVNRLYNECLAKGVYPWNTTIITPLHKKGDIYNPDNYRAIAVGSNLGKLFSIIMLQRLTEFRRIECPDTENQLGFCQGAQTADHLLALQTCIEKYVKTRKERLYTCFVDFKKAFDTICREALLHKLSGMGMEGKFFDCITHMYRNSKARIKIINKLSDAIDILCGTEQGHPISPELFKIYIHQLSVDLNNMSDNLKLPLLNNVQISHLLWADDLVLLARDKRSLEEMLEKLRCYCDEWGLEVSISENSSSKTAIMIFNSGGRQLKESHQFNYGSTAIPSAKSYTYLGITFTLSGSLSQTQQLLRQKGIRAYFGMKKFVDIKHVSKIAAFKLYESLIQPVVTYGFQIWLPHTAFCRILSGDNFSISPLSKIVTDPLERLHVCFLKWTLGISKKTSNASLYGDSGRIPTALRLLKQLIDYFNKLKLQDKNCSNTIVRHAFAEQQQLKLPWYSSILSIAQKLDERSAYGEKLKTKIMPNSSLCSLNAITWFKALWSNECNSNRKLNFYNTVKDEFGLEPYLTKCSHSTSRMVAKLRMSSHSLNVETGRHGSKACSLHNKCCPHCTDQDALELLLALPGDTIPIIEDEFHVLITCPQYEDIRNKLDKKTREALVNNMQSLFEEEKVTKIANYISKVFKKRFPDAKI